MRLFLFLIVLAGGGWLVYDRMIKEEPLVEPNSGGSVEKPPEKPTQKPVIVAETPSSMLENGLFSRALQLLEKVPASQRNQEWSLQKVRALDGLGNRNEALQALEPILAKASQAQKPDLLWLKGNILLDAGEKSKAGKALYQIFSTYPSSSHHTPACYKLKDLWKPLIQDRNSSVQDLINYNKVLGHLVYTAVDDSILSECYQLLGRMNSKIFQGSETIEGILAFHKVNYGENLTTIAKKFKVAPNRIVRINGLRNRNDIRANQTLRILKGNLRMVVDKRRFNMDVYLGDLFFAHYGVGLGRGNKTPETVTSLSRGMAMDPSYTDPVSFEVFPASHEKNPIGTRWMPLQIGRGFGIHGTREPDSIGKESSNGCVRMLNADVEVIYDYAMTGDEVEIR